MADGSIRKIIHLDMDAFYASVEQRDDPALRGQPLAVGGSPQRGRAMGAPHQARPVRRALGYAIAHSQAALPGAVVREAALRRLQAGVAPDPRDLPRIHAAG